MSDLITVIEIDPETLAILHEWSAPATFNNKTMMATGDSEISGITFIPNAQHAQGGVFYIANRVLSLTDTDNISAVLQVELPLKSSTLEPKLVGCICPGVIDLSGLTYDSQSDQVLVISDSTNTVMMYSPEGQLLTGYALPGDDQKGITIDKDGFVYTVEDTGTYSGDIIIRTLVSE